MKIKQALTIFVAAAMAVSASACSTSTSSSSTASSSTNSSTESTAGSSSAASSDAITDEGASNPMPICTDGSITLSIACPDNYYSAAPTTDELPVWAWVKEHTGISIDWQVVPNSEFGTTIQTRMASGIDLPDILSSSSIDTTIYGEDGMLVEMSDLIARFGENFNSVLAEKPNLLPLMKTPDGKVYHLSTTRDEELYAGAIGFQIRKDWLDRLGLEEPKTVDDWYTVLKAFKEQDANGNGDPNDEIPMSAESSVTNIYRWGNAWGLRLWQSDGFSIDENGKVQYDFLKPEAKEVNEFVAKLYAEGLMDPEAITNTADDLTSKAINNQLGSSLYWQELCPTWNKALKATGDETAQWVQVRTPEGPNGYPGHIEMLGYASGKWSISKDCENPEAAFKWLDYNLYNYDCVVTRTIGVEGQTYNIVDGKYVMTDFVTNNPDGLGYVEAIRSTGGWSPVNVTNYAELIQLFKLADDQEIARAQAVADQIIPKTEFAISSLEEAEELNLLYTDITTYRDEMMTKFFLGTESLDNWDTFTQTLMDMGIEDVLAIKQQQYYRLLSFGYTQY